MASAAIVSHPERWATALSGAALVVWGAERVTNDRRPLGALLATAGAGLLWRASVNGTRARLAGPRGTVVEQAVSINRTPHELYSFWRNFEGLPRIVPQLLSVRQLDGRQSRWTARGPAGGRVTWTAEIINDVQDEMIAWRSMDGAQVASAGSIHFEGGSSGRGTTVRIKLHYDPPGGKAGAALAWAFGGAPEQAIREGLRRFKQLMETGELATIDGQPRGAK